MTPSIKTETDTILIENLQLIEELEISVDDLNTSLQKYLNLATIKSNGIHTSYANLPGFPDIIEIDLRNIEFKRENTRNLLIYLLFDNRYISIAKSHGLRTILSVAYIEQNFDLFLIDELYLIAENYVLKNGRYTLPGPILPPPPPLVLSNSSSPLSKLPSPLLSKSLIHQSSSQPSSSSSRMQENELASQLIHMPTLFENACQGVKRANERYV